LLYEELLQEPHREYEVVAKRLDDWIAKLDSSNKSRQENISDIATPRIASEDAMWWVRNGFTGYYMGFDTGYNGTIC